MIAQIIKTKTFKLLILSLSLVYSLLSYFWWLGYTDHYYWMILSNNPEYDYMEVLSLFVMQKWFVLFGQTQIAARLLAWLINAITLFIPYCFIIDKNNRWDYVYVLSASFVILGAGIHKLCNPDIFTALCCSVIFTLVYKNKNSLYGIKIICLLILVSAISIAIRFPNIVIVPWMLAILILSGNKSKKGLVICAIYTITTLIFYYLILLMCTSDFHCISNMIQNSNGDGSHDFIWLIKTMIIALMQMYPLAIIIAIIVLFRLVSSKFNDNSFLYVTLFFAIAIVLYCLFSLRTWLSAVGISTFIALLSVLYRRYTIYGSKQELLFYAFAFTIVFIPVLGSNTGYIKTIIIGSALIPILYQHVNAIKLNRHYVQFALIVSILFSIYIQNNNNIYGKITDAKSYLKGRIYVFDKTEKIKTICDIKKSVIPYFNKDHTVFYGGDYANLLYLETESKPICKLGCWMYETDTNQIKRAINAVKSDDRAFFLDFAGIDSIVFKQEGMRQICSNEYFSVYK